MKEEKQYLTKEKFKELRDELDFLKTTRRKEVAENLEYAKGLGDLSENAEYHEARELQANVEDRIARIEVMLKSAVILAERHEDTVGIGSTVVIQKGNDSAHQKYRIVGSEEVDTASGKISNQSPVGAALIGKRKGDGVTIKTPKGEIKYTIVNIE